MAKLDVDPAALVAVAGQYEELAARAGVVMPQVAVEVAKVAQTHGAIGYPVAVGLAAGMARQEPKFTALVAEFVARGARFTEHAATYLGEDAAAAATYSAASVAL